MLRFFVAIALAAASYACTSAEAPAGSAVTEWEYSLANPVGGNPTLGRPGSRLSLSGDTLTLIGLYGSKVLTVLPPGPRADTLEGVTYQRRGEGLLLRSYRGDSLRHEVLFDPLPPPLRPPAPGELVGRSFAFSYNGTDSLAVYFGRGKGFYPDETALTDYFADGTARLGNDHSRVIRQLYFQSRNYPVPLTDPRFPFRADDETGLSSYPQEIGYDEEGRLVAVHVKTDRGGHRRRRLPLRPLPSVVPASVTAVDLAEQMSRSRISVDKSYVPADSADLAYAYTDRFNTFGLEFDEADHLVISAEPGGDFVVYVDDKVVVLARWELSADRNFIILEQHEGGPPSPHQITAYAPDRMTLRLPLAVKTREPRGKELESYVSLDAHLTLTAATPGATSR